MRNRKIYNAVLLLFLICIVCVGLLSSLKDLKVIFNGAKTEGIVVDAYCTKGCHRRVVEIEYADSSDVSYQITKIGTFFPLHNVGETVVIYYDKTNPNKSIDFSSFVFVAPIVGFSTLVLLVLWLVSLCKDKKAK